jgi:hypothetical protein
MGSECSQASDKQTQILFGGIYLRSQETIRELLGKVAPCCHENINTKKNKPAGHQ